MPCSISATTCGGAASGPPATRRFSPPRRTCRRWCGRGCGRCSRWRCWCWRRWSRCGRRLLATRRRWRRSGPWPHPVRHERLRVLELEVGVPAHFAIERGHLDVAVVVPGEEPGGPGQLPERLGKGVEHQIRVSATEIAAAAAVDEDRVAGEERVAGVQALRARGVARGVDLPGSHAVEGDRVTGSQWPERVVKALEVVGEVDLRPLDVDGEIPPLEDLRHSVGVVLVGVGEEDAREPLGVDSTGLLDGVHVPGRVHHHHVPFSLGADEVDEVLHRAKPELVQEELCGHGCSGGRSAPVPFCHLRPRMAFWATVRTRWRSTESWSLPRSLLCSSWGPSSPASSGRPSSWEHWGWGCSTRCSRWASCSSSTPSPWRWCEAMASGLDRISFPICTGVWSPPRSGWVCSARPSCTSSSRTGCSTPSPPSCSPAAS